MARTLVNAHQLGPFSGSSATEVVFNKGTYSAGLSMDSGSVTDVSALSFDGGGTLQYSNSQIQLEGAVRTTGALTVEGNLVVNGNTLTIESSTIAVEDSMIELAKDNSLADSLDIGMYGAASGSSGATEYFGLFRDATDGKFKLFKENQAQPTSTVNTGGTGYAPGDLLLGDLEVDELAVSGDVVLTGGGSLEHTAGSTALTITSAGHISKIGQSTPSDGYSLQWDNANSKAVWANAAGDISADGDLVSYSGGVFSTIAAHVTSSARLSVSTDPNSFISYNSATGVFDVVDAAFSGSLGASISVVDNSAAGHGALSFNGTNGVFTYEGVSVAEIRGDVSRDVTQNVLSYNAGTGVFGIVAAGLTSSARQAIAIAAGENMLDYNSATGVLGIGAVGMSASVRVMSSIEAGENILTYNSATGVHGIGAVGMSASVRGMFSPGGDLITYDAPSGVIGLSAVAFSASSDVRFDAKLAASDTADLSEGTNLYYTNERVDDRLAAVISGGDGLLAVYDDDAGTFDIAVQVTGAVGIDGDKIGLSGSMAGDGLRSEGGANSLSALHVNADESTLTVSSDALEIKNLGVTLAKMAANSIDSDQYVDGSIDLIHMSANSVDSDQYVDGSIDLIHMSDNSVDSDQYVDGSIDEVHLGDNQVTLAKMAGIARGSILIGDASGDPATLANGAAHQFLQSDGTDTAYVSMSGDATLAAGAITIADNAVTLAKMAGIARGSVIIGDNGGDPATLARGSAHQFLQSDGTDITYVSMSGDATLAAGVLTIAANAIQTGMVHDDVATELAGAGLIAASGVMAIDFARETYIGSSASGYTSATRTFALTSAPVLNSEQVFLNGQLLHKGADLSNGDYTLSSTTLVLHADLALDADDVAQVRYLK
jgi:hypothetical protein